MPKSFEQWMKEVDTAVGRRVGLSVHDLADCSFYDWFEDGIGPAEAARLAIRENA